MFRLSLCTLKQQKAVAIYSCRTHTFTGHIHMCKDNQKPLQWHISGILCHCLYKSKEKERQLSFSHF